MTDLVSEDLKAGYRAGLEAAVSIARTCASETPPASAADVLTLLETLAESPIIEPGGAPDAR